MLRTDLHNGRTSRYAKVVVGLALSIATTAMLAREPQKDPDREKGKDRPSAQKQAPQAGAPAEARQQRAPNTANAPPVGRVGRESVGEERVGAERKMRTPQSTPAAAPAEARQQRTPNTANPPPANRVGRENAGDERKMRTPQSTPAAAQLPADRARPNQGVRSQEPTAPPPPRTGSGLERDATRRPNVQGTTVAPPQRNAGPPTPQTFGSFERNAARPPDRMTGAPPQPGVRETRTAAPGFTRDVHGKVEAFHSRSGSEVRYRPDGQVGVVKSGGMTIQHGAGNARRIMVERKDRSVIVTNRSGHGYVQRPFAYRGQELVNRTYYLRGQSYSRYYQPYSFHGVMLNGYVPTRSYNPGFYGWFNRPWTSRVVYPWGWLSAPWYGYYRGYFTPYPFYSSPAFWLTDFILSARLAEDYADRGNGPPLYGAVMMSPGVKQLISVEVERQLELERAEADALASNELPDPQGAFPSLLSDRNPPVFVVSFTLDVVDASGRGCPIGRGDVLRLTAPPPANAVSAYLQVVAAKPGSCPVGSTVLVDLQDLQDIYNQMRETMMQGVEELRSRAGQNGVPQLPAGAGIAPRQASFLTAAPPPDAQVAAELTQEVQAADRVEQTVTSEATSAQQAPADSVVPLTISLGQTTGEVIAALGNPKQIVNLGSKQIYIYPQMKVTFLGGKVSDVE